MGIVTTKNYDLANNQAEKEPIWVLQIEGVDTIFSSATIYSEIKYDDPGIFYDGTYNYDQLIPYPGSQMSLIDRKGSSSTISQKLEQWDGKASVETFNIKLIDYQQVFTQICSPGEVIEDILNRKITFYTGFRTISWPQDYAVTFKGYINGYSLSQGSVYFTFTDPSSKRKVNLFNNSSSTTTVAIVPTDTIINMTSTSNLYETILNAKGQADPGVQIGIVLDGKEICTYVNSDILSGTQLQVVRGTHGTVADSYDVGTQVTCFIYMTDNPVNIALKTMLSGWNGPCFEDIGLRGIVNDDSGNIIPDSITGEQDVNFVKDYGLNYGDFVTISNSPIPTNNGTFTVAAFANDNRTIITVEKGILIQENPMITGDLAAVMAIRSKYDVYPVEAGLSLTTDDVFVSRFEFIRNTFVTVIFYFPVIGQENSGKQWIEEFLFKAIGAYSLTQGSRISMGITHPPLVDDLSRILSPDNIIKPNTITVNRSLNDRFFYNEIYFQYNYDVIADDYFSSSRFVDADAQKRMRQVSVLSIDIKALPNTALTRQFLADRARRLLLRYKYAAETIQLTTQFSVGHTIDAGDIAILTDTVPSTLQISNTNTGERGITSQVMEVQNRSIDLSAGTTNVTLLSNNGFSATDRYGVIGPASNIDPTFANTPIEIKILDSFGALVYPGAEFLKWQPYQGYYIKVHNKDYSLSANTTFQLDFSIPYIMHLNPPLPFTPTTDFVVEFEDYDATNANTNALIKATYVSYDPFGDILSGSSATVFVLYPGFAIKFQAGMVIYVISPDGNTISNEVKIVSVVGDVVTIGPLSSSGSTSDLGFVPLNGYLVQLAGFKDSGTAYRYV